MGRSFRAGEGPEGVGHALDRRLDRLPFDVWLNFELFPERGEPPAG